MYTKIKDPVLQTRQVKQQTQTSLELSRVLYGDT